MRIYWDTIPKHWSRPPKKQFPVGSRVYVGHQGQGKTLSMVDYVFRLREEFPDCKVVSNIKLYGIRYYHFNDADELIPLLSMQNGANGVVILIDEAHLFFNKKTGISLDVLTAISQQRKDRKRLVFSSQIWEELDISLRKQVKEIVSCHCIGGHWQFNDIQDGETLTYDKLQSEYVANHVRYEIFKHNDYMYKRYDTFQKIVSNKDYHRDLTGKVEVYNEKS